MSKEKPVSMSYRDWFVRKLAEKSEHGFDVIDSVVKHQFESASIALQKNKKVEISGFGVFLWNDKRALVKLDKMDKQITRYRDMMENAKSQTFVQRYSDIIDEILIRRQILINRINELNANLRGLEK